MTRMDDALFTAKDRQLIGSLAKKYISPFDLIPHQDMREKLVELVLNDTPADIIPGLAALFGELRQKLLDTGVETVKVVVFGGGTGLSNIIGGDSRQARWTQRPFDGLKRFFPQTRAVVCITDDGGSTGELLKDVPVFGVGDIRHVMLSSVQVDLLQQRYGLSERQAVLLTADITRIFNYRFSAFPESARALLRTCGADLERMPQLLLEKILSLLQFCLEDAQCAQTFGRSHCLGNLLVTASVRKAVMAESFEGDHVVPQKDDAERIYDMVSELGAHIGCCPDAVMPATSVPAQLRFRYSDGVEVTGEKKSSEAQRSAAVERVTIDFSGEPYVSERVLTYIRDADILIMAPGSLYSSIIPVMQVPGIAEAVRENATALKLLIANLWVQEGETDKSISDPDRKFHVSDMVRAYEQNLPGGVAGLFDQILCLSMQDVPGSVIQNYAVEGKNPIYLDRELIKRRGFTPIECGFFSKEAMVERGVIQHDPDVVARVVKTLFLGRALFRDEGSKDGTAADVGRSLPLQHRLVSVPSIKYRKIAERLTRTALSFVQCRSRHWQEDRILPILVDILWSHQDIPLSHLDNVSSIVFIEENQWRRDQRWDNVFSFYDPAHRAINIREDRLADRYLLEVSFLIALGQALLGDYAAAKIMIPLLYDGREIGSVYHLSLRDEPERFCYFSDAELRQFLTLSRMVEQTPTHFTRAVNGTEGFTPPGLLMGLLYAWYLDNRFANHIEYKMSILKIRPTQLIPEQKKQQSRREDIIAFFRNSVFGKEVELWRPSAPDHQQGDTDEK